MDLFDLVARLTLDSKDFEDKIDKSEQRTGKFASTLKNGLVSAAKASAAALAAMATAATAATVKIVKDATAAYANYQQLTGGVETLFGAGGQSLEEYADSVGLTVDEAVEQYNKLMSAQNDVLNNASEAYKTAGMSANEYMETVTSFSASLIQSLDGDTAAAAKYADMAIRDMSDNANKMGTDMASIQNAYQGFAKQNYTMLDNLKLGYGGTKTEMERLIEDAEKLNSNFKAARDENGDLIMSYSDVVDAIHIVQDEIGISGTTAKEAAGTISGSAASARAAWQNLITGLADGNADISKLISEFIESIKGAASNMMPTIKTALKGVVQLISELAPAIAKELPGLIKDILPDLINTINSMLPALIDATLMLIDVLVDALVDNIDTIVDAGMQLIMGLLDGFVKALPKLLEGLVKLIKALAEGIKTNIRPIMQAVAQVLRIIADMFKDPEFVKELIMIFVGLAIEIVKAVIEILPDLIGSLGDILSGLLGGLWLAIQEIFAPVGDWFNKNVIQPITGFFSNAWETLKNGAKTAWDGIKSVFKAVPDWFKNVFTRAWQGVKDVFSTGGRIFDGIKEGIVSAFKTVVNAIIKGLNKVIAVPFNSINGILNKIHDLEFLGIAPFKNLWEWNPLDVPEIPLLARGGIINRPTLAMLGEAGREAVVPLENNTEWTKKVAHEMALEMQSDNKALNDIQKTLEAILSNMGVDIVLSDGVIAGRVDRILGQTALRKARGNA